MIDIVDGDARDVASIMPVMENAFDPLFGESWTTSQCLTALTMPNCQLLMARISSGPQNTIGFAISRWVLDEEELLMIGVARNFQRTGVASGLMGHLTRNATCAARKFIFLEVRDGNPAFHFYENSGFSETGRRANYYQGNDGKRYDSITMTLHL